MKQKAYVLIGLPGSGKSTWTEKKMQETNPRGIGVVSRDAIRYMINGNYKYLDEQQHLITDIAESAAKSILSKGYDLIIDQANISKSVRREVAYFLRTVEDKIEIHFIYMMVDDTDYLVKRRMTGDARGENEAYHYNVIEKMKRNFVVVDKEEDYDILEEVDAGGKVVYKNIKEVHSVEKKEIPLEELWSLHNTLAEYIYPRLKAFRDNHCGGPNIGRQRGWKNGSFYSKGKYGPKYRKNLCFKYWDEIMDKMVLAFELTLSSDDWDCYPNDKEYKKRWSQIEEGFSLFAKYFHCLWW